MSNSPTADDFLASVERLKSESEKYHVDNGDEMAVKVSSNLLVRHTQLYWLEELTRAHDVHQALINEQNNRNEKSAVADKSKQSSDTSNFCNGSHKFSEKLLPEERAYHLAVTDLFVEKAQAFLEQRADSYQRSGKWARRIACVTVVAGAGFACQQMISHHGGHARSWLELISTFTRAFTAYGLVVLAAVGFWKYSKAMLDQSERLFERRHALRQGRLFVHLNDGKLTIDQMEKAFKWNESQENAFANINTEASAPWGVVAKEFAKSFPEIFKAGLQGMGKGKSEDK